MVRALGLLSGGLDSLLAVRLLQEQGIEVECVNFYTGFCIQGHTGAMRNPKPGAPPPRHDALHGAAMLGVKLHIIDIAEEYVAIVTNPRYGYGANLNPCLDCKIHMVRRAWELARARGFSFIFTGEVVGERPMSQRRDLFPKIQKEAGVDGWLLRPLSARILPETEPERQGLVDRLRLMGISGRSRKPQMALAKQFGITEYPTPAGGCCYLTDENYARRLADLWSHRGTKVYSQEDILLLKAGRHLRPDPAFKLIVGRDEAENHFLSGFRQGRIALQATVVPGPLALVEGVVDEAGLELCCRLVARFGKGRTSTGVVMGVERDKRVEEREIIPLPPEEIPKSWYL